MSETMTAAQDEMTQEQIAEKVTSALEQIFAEIHKPCTREEMPRRVGLCRLGLELMPQELNLQLWAVLQTELGDSLAQSPEGDQAANQEEAIAAYQRVLSTLAKEEIPELWRQATANLANVLSDRRGGQPAKNLEEAIALNEQALVGLNPESEPDLWTSVMNNLAGAYTQRCQGIKADNIEKAIEIYGQIRSVQTHRRDAMDRARTTFNFALAYIRRIRGDRADNLERALKLIDKAAEVITRDSDSWAWANLMNSLANVYAERIRGSRSANLQRAAEAYCQALEVLTLQSFPSSWALVQNNFGLLYFDQIAGDPAEHIELAIHCFEQALTVRTRETAPFRWAESMHNLANAYKKRVHGARSENIEKAIECFQQALSVRTRDALPYEWAATVDDLAIAYTDRILGDRAEHLERAIEYLESALEVRTSEALPQEWALTSNHLGIAYLFRIRGAENDNLETAIATLSPVLEVWTRKSNPIGYAETSVHLGHAYYKLTRGERRLHLEQAILAYQNAVEAVTRKNDPVLWAQAMVGLGCAYQQRQEGIRSENFKQSIRSFRAALSVFKEPFDRAHTMNNLANTYRLRSQSRRGSDFSHARDLYFEVLRVLTLEAAPADHLQTQSSLGRMEFAAEHWDKAHDAFSKALTARDLLYAAGATTEARQHALEDAAEVPAMDAYCLARLGRTEEGIVVLEQTRARSLRESLARNEAALGQASAEHREAFIAARGRIATLEAEARIESVGKISRRSFLEISSDLGVARQDLAKLAERIRSYAPGFMPVDLGFPEIAETASFVGLPLIYLATVYKGSLAFIVTPAGLSEVFWLPDFTRADLDALLFDSNEPRYLIGAVLGDTEALNRSLDAAWSELGPKLLNPLAGHLAAQGFTRAALIAAGTLDLLPLPAIAPAEVLFTLAPSARALSTACRTLRQRSGLEPVFLGIADPRPSSDPPLPAAAREVETAALLFPTDRRRVLLREDATREAVIKELPGATHLHFACHGQFDPITPLDSKLVLAGEGRLTWRDILDGGLDLSAARVTVLSACQSGIKDYRETPDEVIGFPSALLQAGVPGVLSTLWSVTDISTGLLLTRFYELCIGKLGEKLDAAAALHEAQKWLRHSTAKDLGLAEHWERIYRENSSRDAFKRMRYYRSDPLVTPFAHPYYWAGFVFSGASA